MGQTVAPPGVQVPTQARFGVLGFLCSLSLLTYLDRVCIMRVQENIQGDLGLSQQQMGYVFSAFLLGYALFEIPGGRLGDFWGARRVLTLFVVCWSVFTALTGFIWPFTLDSGLRLEALGLTVPLLFNSFLLILLVRFLFGSGEAGAYPNLARIVGAWFPFQERAVAQGAIWMCARLGGAVAPFVFGRLTVHVGWRQAFWVLGVVGAAWCLAFYRWFRNTPEEQPKVNAAELELIRSGPYSWKADQAGPAHGRVPWGLFLRNSTVLALFVAVVGVNFGWYFYPTWQPRYLKEEFGISYEGSEIITGLPFLCGAAGCLLGGRLSDLLVRRTGNRRWSRSSLGLFGWAGAGACVLCTGLATQAWQAVTLLCLASFLSDIVVPLVWTVCTDIGGRYSGTLSGMVNMVGGVGAITGPIVVPVLRQHVDWPAVFAIMALSWFIAALAWLFIDASKPLEPEPVDASH